MNGERNLGVTEAGLGLTLVICLLLVFGYMTLHYLGGARQAPTVETRPGYAGERAATRTTTPSGEFSEGNDEPQVLTIESSDVPGQALRPSTDSMLR